MAYRRVVIVTSEWAAVVWAKRHAKSTFLVLFSDCTGLSDPLDSEVVHKELVTDLPLTPEALDSTATVVFYGNYGEFGQVIRWDEFGNSLAPLEDNQFIPPRDIKNISGRFIGHDTANLLRLNPRKPA